MYKRLQHMEVKTMKKQMIRVTHLTFHDRIVIQTGITNLASKKAIADTLGRDPSTIGKEIKRNRLHKPTPWTTKSPSNDACARRDRTPGACNGCPLYSQCKKTRYFYDAQKAHEKYRLRLISTRGGIYLNEDERRYIGKIISPLIKKRQSIYQILNNHPEITVVAKTLYNYIDRGVFRDYGVINLSLKEKVNRKTFKPRYRSKDSATHYLKRRYTDFIDFATHNPSQQITEMDTVYNSPEGPYLQTLIFRECQFMIGFIHARKTCGSMVQAIQFLEDNLGHELFKELFGLILTDRGTEFRSYDLFEKNCEGKQRLSIYYCDPMCAHQKPYVENNHNFARDIIPNSFPLKRLKQSDINLMFTHINNTPRASLCNHTPIELLKEKYHEKAEKLLAVMEQYSLHYDEVTLSPELFK